MTKLVRILNRQLIPQKRIKVMPTQDMIWVYHLKMMEN